MRFNIGDTITINLRSEDKGYKTQNYIFDDNMYKFNGQTAKIMSYFKIRNRYAYELDIDRRRHLWFENLLNKEIKSNEDIKIVCNE